MQLITTQQFIQEVQYGQHYNLTMLDQTFLSFNQNERLQIITTLMQTQLSLEAVDVVDHLSGILTGRVQVQGPAQLLGG